MSEYEPGTVAVATVRGVPNVRVVRVAYNTTPPWMTLSVHPGGAIWHAASHVIDVRPLVVLDPVEITTPDETGGEEYAAPEIVKCLRRIGEDDHPSSYRRKIAERIADQIEQQTSPPKPPEPTGLGAVVEDSEGVRWIRTAEDPEDHYGKPWQSGPVHKHWQIVDAVRVLSEGVTA